MRKAYFLFLIFLFSLFTFSPISTQAITINSSQYWFYVSEPTLIDYPQMSFQVINTRDIPVTINCSFEPITGIEVDVFLEWESSILEAGEIKQNHYSIYANITYAATVRIEITVSEYIGGNLGTAATVANYIVFYSGEEGHLLDVEVIDQSGVPRLAEIAINHKFSLNQTWTPIALANDSTITGYYPQGHYFIQARDIETNIYSESLFYLDNNTKVFITLQLVGFNRFKFMQDPEDNEIIGVNTTIFNNLQELHDIEIFAEIYRDGKIVKTTSKVFYSLFPSTTDWTLEMWFPRFDWTKGNYSIIGKMVSHEILVAFKVINFRYSPVTQNISFTEIVLIGLSGLVIGLIIKFEYDKRKFYAKMEANNSEEKTNNSTDNNG